MSRMMNPILPKPGQTAIESVMEQMLRDNLPKEIPWAAEVKVVAGDKRFRVDFMVSANGSHVAIECDGTDFHEFNSDRGRDHAMLFVGTHGHPALPITDVLRFRGCDLVHSPDECLAWFRRLFPNAFNVSAEAYSAAEKAWASVGMTGAQVKPILRASFPLCELRTIESSPGQAWSISAGRGFRGIVQLKSPYWHKSKSASTRA